MRKNVALIISILALSTMFAEVLFAGEAVTSIRVVDADSKSSVNINTKANVQLQGLREDIYVTILRDVRANLEFNLRKSPRENLPLMKQIFRSIASQEDFSFARDLAYKYPRKVDLLGYLTQYYYDKIYERGLSVNEVINSKEFQNYNLDVNNIFKVKNIGHSA